LEHVDNDFLMEFGEEGGCLEFDADVKEIDHGDIDEDGERACNVLERFDGFVCDGNGLLIEFVVVHDFIEDDLLDFQETDDLLPLRVPLDVEHDFVLRLI
jgi:hypothetical protein